jgi:hypothetical protein
MRRPHGLRLTSIFLSLAVAACGAPGSSPSGGSHGPMTTHASTAAPSAGAAGGPLELIDTRVPLQPINVGVPRTWVVLDRDGLVDLVERLRDLDPVLADAYETRSSDSLVAVDLDALPGSFSALESSYSCDSTPDAAFRLERLRERITEPVIEADVVDLAGGQAAMVLFVRVIGTTALTMSIHAWSAPTTDCDGTFTLVLAESAPQAGLAAAIAQSVSIDTGGGAVTVELRDSITLPETCFPVVCVVGGESGADLRMSSGTPIEGMSVDLAVDPAGQPVFFQFANSQLMYFSGKGFDASAVFVPEAGSTRERGSATFADITPPDDPEHPLSGRVAWNCAA